MDWGFQLGPNDDFVVDLLSQFDAASAQAQAEQPAAESSHNSQSTGSRVQPVNELQETLQLAVTIEDGQPSGLKLAAVEIPAVVNGEEYKNLPGHSAVRYIISEEQDDDGDIVYKVRMRSSELQIVRSGLLLVLDAWDAKASSLIGQLDAASKPPEWTGSPRTLRIVGPGFTNYNSFR